MKIVELEHWAEFAGRLSAELRAIGHSRMVSIRIFGLVTASIDPVTMDMTGGDVDRLDLVRKNGTDRTEDSSMWNAPGHDYDHDEFPAGKIPSEIIYAYSAHIRGDNYVVHLEGEELDWDLTEKLDSNNGILIYDRAKLRQVAKNEYWFVGPPKDALLLVMITKGS